MSPLLSALLRKSKSGDSISRRRFFPDQFPGSAKSNLHLKDHPVGPRRSTGWVSNVARLMVSSPGSVPPPDSELFTGFLQNFQGHIDFPLANTEEEESGSPYTRTPEEGAPVERHSG